MNITASSMDGLTKGFSTLFNKGFSAVTPHYKSVAMIVPSSTASLTHTWMADLPQIREWIGDRTIADFGNHGFEVRNLEWELTQGIKRTHIEDDQVGLYSPIMEKMGYEANLHPDKLVFDLLGKGFEKLCYDGQYFFDAEHPAGKDGASHSNVQDGEGEPWFLLDARQPLKPLFYQERLPFQFEQITEGSHEHVFMKGEYLYGIRSRSNVGFGLWQMAYASKAPLNAVNYEAARASMQSIKGESGKPLNVMPSHLVVPPSLEGPARRLLKATSDNGATNEWAGSAELIVTPFLI